MKNMFCYAASIDLLFLAKAWG